MLLSYILMCNCQGQCFLHKKVLAELLDALQAALWLSPKLHVTPGNLNLTILLLSLMLYDPLMQHILGPGGAVFNPANSVAFGAAGTGPGPFSHHLLRSVRDLRCTAGLATGCTLQECSTLAEQMRCLHRLLGNEQMPLAACPPPETSCEYRLACTCFEPCWKQVFTCSHRPASGTCRHSPSLQAL